MNILIQELNNLCFEGDLKKIENFIKENNIDLNNIIIYEKIIITQYNLRKYNIIQIFLNCGLQINSQQYFVRESIIKNNFNLFKLLIDNNFDLNQIYYYCPIHLLNTKIKNTYVGLIVQLNRDQFIQYILPKIDFKNHQLILPCSSCITFPIITPMNLLDLAIYTNSYKIIPFLVEQGLKNKRCLNFIYCKNHENHLL